MGALLSPGFLDDLRIPDISAPVFFPGNSVSKNIFEEKSRKKWHADSAEEARCDFAPNRFGIRPKAGLWYLHLWKRSVKGRKLSDIKADDSMIEFFATNIAGFISVAFGKNLAAGGFALVTTPARRHKERNFGESAAKRVADRLGIKFYPFCALSQNKQRIGAVFLANNIPEERNVIVFDDIVTTGSTFISMNNLLKGLGKNCFFVAGICNA